eukprot:6182159-Pleurochrysis_carterae.AAC.1
MQGRQVVKLRREVPTYQKREVKSGEEGRGSGGKRLGCRTSDGSTRKAEHVAHSEHMKRSRRAGEGRGDGSK